MRTLVVLLLATFAWGGETGAIEGRLHKADGKPWPGAEITAYRLAKSQRSTPAKTVHSGEGGRFKFRDLAPGRYFLEYGPKARAIPDPELAQAVARVRHMMMSIKLAHVHEHANIVTVVPGKTTAKNLQQSKRVTARFVVLSGREPVCDAEIKLMAVDKHDRATISPSFGGKRPPRTDSRGAVAIARVPEGRYVVIVKVGDWSVYAGPHEIRGRWSRTVPVELGAYVARLKVLDARGQPATLAMVSVEWGTDARSWDFVRSRDMKKTHSEDGVYEVPFVRAGKLTVRVNAKGDSSGMATGPVVGDKNPKPEVVVRLDPTATLIVRVVDAEGNPVAGVHVNIENADSERGIPSFGYDVNRLGEHRQEVTLRRWRVRVEDSEHGRGQWTIVRPTANEEKLVELRLPKKR